MYGVIFDILPSYGQHLNVKALIHFVPYDDTNESWFDIIPNHFKKMILESIFHRGKESYFNDLDKEEALDCDISKPRYKEIPDKENKARTK